MRTKIGKLSNVASIAFLAVLVIASTAIADNPACYDYTPGDVNGDGNVMGNDVTYGVRYFKGIGAAPPDSCKCRCNWLYLAGDANGSCTFTGSDITYLVAYFKGSNPEILSCDDCPTLVDVWDSDINSGDSVHWTSNHVYVLNNFVFVDNGARLYIDPGTIVKGLPGQGADAKALIVARGGKIYAEGTQDCPIIFTSIADYTDIYDDLPENIRGLWGGLIVLGQAVINTTAGEGQIEGIPTSEPRGAYGGSDDDDNSGIIRYVSIRYGGTEIGAANEINGLTMGAVGRGTIIEYVEVANNLDDGFEWFGGTVNCRYLVSAYVGDDNFDYDEGYRGNGQYWFCIQDPTVGNRGGEHDGGTDPEDGTPYAEPVISNATYIGSGAESENFDSDWALKIRDNAGGHYSNSIFTEFRVSGVDVEDLDQGEDSRHRLEVGDLTIEYTYWHHFGNGDSPLNLFPDDFVRAYMMDPANHNQIADPQFGNIDWSFGGGNLDPRPDADGPCGSGAVIPSDPWFNQVDYIGAFEPDAPLWTEGWTWLSGAGYTISSGR